jgi:hypothetical protein
MLPTMLRRLAAPHLLRASELACFRPGALELQSLGGSGSVRLLGARRKRRSLRKQAEEIAHASAGMLQIDNRILSVPTRGSAF